MKTEVRIFRALPEDAARIRRAVFMEEQGFHDEFDKADETASHLVLYIDGTPAATCRFFPGTSAGEYIVGRIAVRKESRGQHLGSRVLLAAEEAIRKAGGSRIVLHAQEQARPFYEKQGYTAYGTPDLDEDHPHIWMAKTLS